MIAEPNSCFILDDEPFAIKCLSIFVDKIKLLTLKGSATNPLEALGYLRKNKVSILFLDIDMAEMNGLEFARFADLNVIWTTAHESHVFQSLEYEKTIDYLLKPITYDRFQLAVKRALNMIAPVEANPIAHAPITPENFCFFSSLGKKEIPFASIDYIQAWEYVSIMYCGKEKITVPIALKDIEQQLPDGTFVRVHRSFIVNKSKILRTRYEKVELEGRITLPIGRSYRSNLNL